MTARHVALLTFFIVVGSAAARSSPLPLSSLHASNPYSRASDRTTAPSDRYAEVADPDVAPPADDGEPDFRVFFSKLSPYGRWVLRGDYGWVWVPIGVSSAWRPYTVGHWEMSEDGWLWVSEEPFGWATYHYGRWIDDPRHGWMWVPGYDWSPALVAWRAGDGYIGWAPLPPEAFDPGAVDLPVALTPGDFCFVDERSFLEPLIVTFLEPPSLNLSIINNTTYVINQMVVNLVNGVVVNEGVPAQNIEEVAGPVVAMPNPAIVPTGGVRGQLPSERPSPIRPTGGLRTPTTTHPSRAGVIQNATMLAPQHSQEKQALPASTAAERTRLQPFQQDGRQVPQGGSATELGALQEQAQQQHEQPQQRVAAESRQHQAELQAQQQREQQQLEQQRQAELQARQQREQQQREQQRQAELQAQQQREQQRQAELQAQQQRQAEQQAQQQREQQRQAELQAQQQREQQQREQQQREQQRQAELQAQQHREQQQREQQRQAEQQAQQHREQQQREQQRQAEQQAQQQREQQQREQQQRQAEQQAQQQHEQQARQQAGQRHFENPPPSRR